MNNYIQQIIAKLKHSFDWVTQPAESITDPIQRQQIRLINSLVLIFAPIALIAGSLHLVFDPPTTPLIYSSVTINMFFPVFFLVLAAIFGRFVGYWWATLLVFVVGYIVIMINASFDAPDYFDLSYLILLTVLATIMFSTAKVALLAIVEVVSVFFVVSQVSPQNMANLIVFSIVANLVIIITSYYRNLLEKDRYQKLTESEAFLQLLTKQLPVSVWITDEKLSRRATFGRLPNTDQLATIPSNKAIRAYHQALSGDSAQFEDVHLQQYFRYYIEPMRANNEEIIGTIGVATDITEQKLAQQHGLQLQLERERVEILSQFIEHSSHDLRTPISNINTYLYLLDNSVQTDKERGYVNVIREQSERLQSLIDNMLTLQRLELDTDQPTIEILLNSLLDSLAVAYREQIEAHYISFEYIAPTKLIVLNAIEKNVYVALSKMIDNAIQFTPEQGTIRISTSLADEKVTISIEDTGQGIPSEQLPFIFEIFYRGDESRPATSGDNGLGLTIANRIIRAHQGQITVESVVGEGTTFHITLPIVGIKQPV